MSLTFAPSITIKFITKNYLKKMATFTVPTRENVSPNNQVIFDNLKSALGFVPNLYATIAYSSTGLERFLAYQNAKTSISNKDKEAINLIVSQVNGCIYCQSAHLVIGKMNGYTDAELQDIRHAKSDNPKLNALVKLAADIAFNRGNADAKNIDAFIAQGYNNENLVDLILQVSDKTAMNYLHNLTKVPVDFPIAPSL
jgi:uncharacterized peroxidase-related enzyme